MRFELTRPFERYHLKVVRLPISPPTHPLLTSGTIARLKSGGKNRTFGGDFQTEALNGSLFFQHDAKSGAFSKIGLADEELALMVLLDDPFG